MKRWFGGALILGGGVFLIVAFAPKIVSINSSVITPQVSEVTEGILVNPPPEAEVPSSTSEDTHVASASAPKNGDIPKQLPLVSPPQTIRGIYATSWSAGSSAKMKRLMELIDTTELNAIVIDIKDYSGYVAYRTGVPEFEASGAEKDIRIIRPNALIKELHDKNIYVIGRVSVFQDSILTKAHPEWALRHASSGAVWEDRKGLSWLDPTIPGVWDYNIALAKDAFSRGFDEVNFDYIRFASDGDLSAIRYPSWSGATLKSTEIKRFFKYLRENLPGVPISADLFGLVTVNQGDLGIGQVLENAYEYFDFISPMVYPSHYASGFLGYKNPANYPYEVIRYSMEGALARLEPKQATSTDASSTAPAPRVSYRAKLRPWLQDFDLGADYDAGMVRKQIQAVYDVLRADPASNGYNGWLLWNPSNNYTLGALEAS